MNTNTDFIIRNAQIEDYPAVRYIFNQDIFRKADNRLCLRATVELVCLINGRLGNSEDYDRAFGFL